MARSIRTKDGVVLPGSKGYDAAAKKVEASRKKGEAEAKPEAKPEAKK